MYDFAIFFRLLRDYHVTLGKNLWICAEESIKCYGSRNLTLLQMYAQGVRDNPRMIDACRGVLEEREKLSRQGMLSESHYSKSLIKASMLFALA